MSNLAKYALSALLLCQLTTDVKAVTTPPQPVSPDTARINQEIEAYAKEYMHFLSVAKTERRAYAEAVRRLEAAGFKDISTVKSLKPGDKVYRGYHGKTLMACVIGSAPCAVGLRVVGAHIDSPASTSSPARSTPKAESSTSTPTCTAASRSSSGSCIRSPFTAWSCARTARRPRWPWATDPAIPCS